MSGAETVCRRPEPLLPKPPAERVFRGAVVSPYGANIAHVLFNRPATGEHFVWTIYNEHVVPLPGCGGNLTCGLEAFLVHPRTPSPPPPPPPPSQLPTGPVWVDPSYPCCSHSNLRSEGRTHPAPSATVLWSPPINRRSIAQCVEVPAETINPPKTVCLCVCV